MLLSIVRPLKRRRLLSSATFESPSRTSLRAPPSLAFSSPRPSSRCNSSLSSSSSVQPSGRSAGGRKRVPARLIRLDHCKTPCRCSFSTSRPCSSVDQASSPSVGLPPPLNVVQVPLTSPNLQAQLFPPPSSAFAPPPVSLEAIGISTKHLKTHELLSATPPIQKSPAIDFTLPALQGPTISHHFHSIAAETAEPYLSLARDYIDTELPPAPDKEAWSLMPGWTRYSADGSWESVDYPPSDSAMVFDVETLPHKGGHFPIMATAVGKSGWYGWCSPWLTGDDETPNHLIPFDRPAKVASSESTSTLFERPDQKPQLLIGHNVLFDRARVSSEYTLRRPSTRWLDTLSLHVAVSGLTNPQRPAWLKYRKDMAAKAAKEGAKDKTTDGVGDKPGERPSPLVAKAKVAREKNWKEVSSANSLVEVARLHCGIAVDKSLRDTLIEPETTLEDVRASFSDLMAYCAQDVQVTSDVFRVLLPKFLKRCPHPASFSGVVLMSQPVLPVDHHWPQYLERADRTYEEQLKGVRQALQLLAEEARAKMDEKDKNGRPVWESDIWLRQLDWSPKRARRLPGATPARKRSSSKRKATMETNDAPAPISVPVWFAKLKRSPAGIPTIPFSSSLAPTLLRVTWKRHPVVFSHSHGYLFAVSSSSRRKFEPEEGENPVSVDDLGPKDEAIRNIARINLYTIPTPSRGFTRSLLSAGRFLKKLNEEVLGSDHSDEILRTGMEMGAAADEDPMLEELLGELAVEAITTDAKAHGKDKWLRFLDWTPTDAIFTPHSTFHSSSAREALPTLAEEPVASSASTDLVWPKWYWDLDVPGVGLDVTIKQRTSPLLLRLQWKGFPIVYSKEHGWVFRVPDDKTAAFIQSDSPGPELVFSLPQDTALEEESQGLAQFWKLPHPDGEEKNVGSPLSKPFVSAFEEKILTSEFQVAAEALALNASCSYWASARERIKDQMVVWDNDPKKSAPVVGDTMTPSTSGLILPQVTPMGTVTRRAVEKTWLTASNAKKNRVGSELKSMVRAPKGYAIVGADVDSEELWICSVMGDAQFGVHGATAIGWMTLEGTKSAGTDLHSKTASILGISRDHAKVFNYSRIYGAGVKHAVQLLLKSNPNLAKEEATKLAQELYAQTKGITYRSNSNNVAFGRDFWLGGTESFVFNTLESIARSDNPVTPALGCGVTDALKKKHLPADGRDKAGQGYMPSRINWVVQSSGVDYLHLLLVSMEYLCRRFNIDARYMISVHDEIRYLVKEEDKYRAAMALQISNLWTRALFSYRLQLNDLPQSCAFFSAVDIDHCFRKEVNMPCTTPSNPDAIPFGESLDISQCLDRTSQGSLFQDGRSMVLEGQLPRLNVPTSLSDKDIRGEQHRADETAFLVAQTLTSLREVNSLWRKTQGKNAPVRTGPRNGDVHVVETSIRQPRRQPVAIALGEAGAPDNFGVDAEFLRKHQGPPETGVVIPPMPSNPSRPVGVKAGEVVNQPPQPSTLATPHLDEKLSKNASGEEIDPQAGEKSGKKEEEEEDDDVPKEVEEDYFSDTAAATRRSHG
ncbi:hypothetical protein T439DRAFT_314085 [Meredithblackwellia eburnea MCA 4105]